MSLLTMLNYSGKDEDQLQRTAELQQSIKQCTCQKMEEMSKN